MKNNKIALLPGLSLFLCFGLLNGTGRLVSYLHGGALLLSVAEAVSFVLPFALLFFALRDQKKLRRRLRFRRQNNGVWGLSIRLGLTVAILSLLLNLLLYRLIGLAGADLAVLPLDAPQSGMSMTARFYVTVVLGALLEEFYLRGALFAVHEEMVGTSACMLFSGLAFAMLHGNPLDFAGPLIAGIAYAYLTFLSGSVWPAVLAHGVHNLYYLFALWVTDTYAAFGIWNYFVALNGLALLLLLYLTLRSLETMLVKGSIPRFDKSAGLYDLWLLARNPGVLAFVLAFAAKLILSYL